MLEGKELEGNIGNDGKYAVDIDANGVVKAEATYVNMLGDGVQIGGTVTVFMDIFQLAEKLAAKTSTTWDDKAVAALKEILGVKPA